MKTTFKAVLCYLVMAAAIFTGCPTETGDGGTGGGGSLTISGFPAGSTGVVSVYNYAKDDITTKAGLTSAMTDLIATGVATGSSVALHRQIGGRVYR
ncbi:MAG: hypothetical protein LBG08_00660 [Spirochaetaceae bacterium]|jgi:hypothetical protein|nr:hypothetical protein [Spirochaetaceae bacterium]